MTDALANQCTVLMWIDYASKAEVMRFDSLTVCQTEKLMSNDPDFEKKRMFPGRPGNVPKMPTKPQKRKIALKTKKSKTT